MRGRTPGKSTHFARVSPGMRRWLARLDPVHHDRWSTRRFHSALWLTMAPPRQVVTLLFMARVRQADMASKMWIRE